MNSEELWEQASDRMRPFLDALFSQDLGIQDDQKDRFVNRILDQIVRPEFLAAMDRSAADLWSVWRQDDNGNQFELARNLSLHEAEEMVKSFEARGHKQSYWRRLSGK